MAETNTTQRIASCIEIDPAGARATVEALRLIPQAVAGDWTQTSNEFFAKRKAAIATLLAAAGPMPPKAAGAFHVLAEFVVGGEQDACSYDLDRWQPEVAMSETERVEYHRRIVELDAQ